MGVSGGQHQALKIQKFFGSFFQKRTAFFSLPTMMKTECLATQRSMMV
jgi:hypothetical protein